MNITEFTELAILSLEDEEFNNFVKTLEKIKETLKAKPAIIETFLPGEAQFRYTEILNDLDWEISQLVKIYL
jgi:hypothetical protein